MPSIPVPGAIIKEVDRTLHIVLVAVRLVQGLALASGLLNLFDVEDEIRTISVAVQIVGEVEGSNTDELMRQNIRISVKTGFVVFGLFRKNDTDAIHQFEDGVGSKSQQHVRTSVVHCDKEIVDKEAHVLH